MPDIQQAKDILSQCKKKLAQFQEKAKTISTNKDVVAWQKVNIDSFRNVIEDLGLPDDLRHSRDTYPELARGALKDILTLQNNVANLEADINLGPIPATQAIPLAKRIARQIDEIRPAIDKLHHCKIGLESSSIALKKNLNLTTLLPLARNRAEGKKKSVFETGFKIYLITTRETDFEEENQVNMFRHFNKATLLQKKITELDIQGVSKMAEAMIRQQIKLCTDGLQEVKDFILFVEDYVQKDMEHINLFHTQLAEVTKQPLTDILFNIPSETEKVSACIRDFTHKKFLLEEIDRAAQLLLMIEQFHIILHEHFFDYLSEQNSRENGLLNPATLSEARADNYFNGLIGIWRIIRLFLGSINKHKTISKEILQENLQSIIENCDLFFDNEDDEKGNLSTFIQSYFDQYHKPFPHDELINVAHTCLITYGTLLEKIMFRYKVKNENENENKNNYTLGRLSSKIDVRTVNLKKYRKKLTPG